jgi:1-acyl-sn-glycerol-3-phosphate acyltransferase
VRHPVYLGFDVAVAGAGLALGSPALAWVVAPALLPAWMAYAALEERGLARRFGSAWRSYCRRVGMLPRYGVYLAGWTMGWLRLLPVEVRGERRIPRRGGAVVVHNHACYADFLFLGRVTAPRRPAFLVTAEAFRRPVARFLLGRAICVPVRRYRTDPAACREMIRLLRAGHLVVVAPEAERAALGRRLRPLPDVAGILSRLGWPVIPVGISGSYDAGPRWAGVLRRRRVVLRVGPPVEWGPGAASDVLDAALEALAGPDPQPVHLAGIRPERLVAVLWRCPACLAEEPWRPADLACGGCGARWTPTPDGRFAGPQGEIRSLADVAAPAWLAPEAGPLRVPVSASRERSMYGPVEALEPVGGGELEVGPGGLRLGALSIPAGDVRSVTVERGDTLQVATREGMWQFRLARGSAFRLQLAMERWRGAEPVSFRGGAVPVRAGGSRSRDTRPGRHRRTHLASGCGFRYDSR